MMKFINDITMAKKNKMKNPKVQVEDPDYEN